MPTVLFVVGKGSDAIATVEEAELNEVDDEEVEDVVEDVVELPKLPLCEVL